MSLWHTIEEDTPSEGYECLVEFIAKDGMSIRYRIDYQYHEEWVRTNREEKYLRWCYPHEVANID